MLTNIGLAMECSSQTRKLVRGIGWRELGLSRNAAAQIGDVYGLGDGMSKRDRKTRLGYGRTRIGAVKEFSSADTRSLRADGNSAAQDLASLHADVNAAVQTLGPARSCEFGSEGIGACTQMRIRQRRNWGLHAEANLAMQDWGLHAVVNSAAQDLGSARRSELGSARLGSLHVDVHSAAQT
ncbi:PREDICTED: uncharacterized protein LOC105111649 [Populus euphratica]|uniref:Uncharacterized protein LOC105111649 n=1 Tax=Populus euphratica TaxID=75702 RepID=A0AAJ6T678_POPEU|nr:PREDICTED: uncharacterized protein LOC105111649 [Populus euphratica]